MKLRRPPHLPYEFRISFGWWKHDRACTFICAEPIVFEKDGNPHYRVLVFFGRYCVFEICYVPQLGSH